MRYESIRVRSFRSIRDSGLIRFDPRMTVLVGHNNSGKSAVLDAMWRNHDTPHRSPTTVPVRGASPEQTRLERVLAGTGVDVKNWQVRGSERFKMPCPVGFLPDASGAFAALLTAPRIVLRDPVALDDVKTPLLDVLSFAGGRPTTVEFERLPGGGLSQSQSVTVQDHRDLRSQLIWRFFAHQVVRVRAERVSLMRGQIGTTADAGPSAERLASALHYLQGRNPSLFDRIVQTTRGLVPSVRAVGLANLGDREVQIEIWPFDPALMRDDLAVPLEDAGTGIGQVLALVHALLAADEPKVFLIDEPSNFLHPKAVLDLIALLRSHPGHQYVIATHSPEVIAACEPGVVQRVRLVDGETHIEQIDPKNVEEQRRTLVDLGVRLSAFFGADEVLWVEGPTEEAVLPKLLPPELTSGLKILAVHDTGALEGKDPARIVGMYKKLVDGIALIPPAVGFFFDREGRTDAQVKDLQLKTSDRLVFTERRLLENYLLDLDAIAHVLGEEMATSDPGTSFSGADVSEWIRAQVTERGGKFSATATLDEDRTAWTESVHAAKLLEKLFSALTETKLAYRKTRHGPMIADRILATNESFFDPLRDELKAVLVRGRQHTRAAQPR